MQCFHIGDILSVVSGINVSPRSDFSGIYELIKYLSNTNLTTEDINISAEKCKKIILIQHPFLAGIDVENINENNFQSWINTITKAYGKTLPLERI